MPGLYSVYLQDDQSMSVKRSIKANTWQHAARLVLDDQLKHGWQPLWPVALLVRELNVLPLGGPGVVHRHFGLIDAAGQPIRGIRPVSI